MVSACDLASTGTPLAFGELWEYEAQAWEVGRLSNCPFDGRVMLQYNAGFPAPPRAWE